MTLAVGDVLQKDCHEGEVGVRFRIARIRFCDTNYAYPNESRISYELELVTLG